MVERTPDLEAIIKWLKERRTQSPFASLSPQHPQNSIEEALFAIEQKLEISRIEQAIASAAPESIKNEWLNWQEKIQIFEEIGRDRFELSQVTRDNKNLEEVRKSKLINAANFINYYESLLAQGVPGSEFYNSNGDVFEETEAAYAEWAHSMAYFPWVATDKKRTDKEIGPGVFEKVQSILNLRNSMTTWIKNGAQNPPPEIPLSEAEKKRRRYVEDEYQKTMRIVCEIKPEFFSEETPESLNNLSQSLLPRRKRALKDFGEFLGVVNPEISHAEHFALQDHPYYVRTAYPEIRTYDGILDMAGKMYAWKMEQEAESFERRSQQEYFEFLASSHPAEFIARQLAVGLLTTEGNLRQNIQGLRAILKKKYPDVERKVRGECNQFNALCSEPKGNDSWKRKAVRYRVFQFLERNPWLSYYHKEQGNDFFQEKWMGMFRRFLLTKDEPTAVADWHVGMWHCFGGFHDALPLSLRKRISKDACGKILWQRAVEHENDHPQLHAQLEARAEEYFSRNVKKIFSMMDNNRLTTFLNQIEAWDSKGAWKGQILSDVRISANAVSIDPNRMDYQRMLNYFLAQASPRWLSDPDFLKKLRPEAAQIIFNRQKRRGFNFKGTPQDTNEQAYIDCALAKAKALQKFPQEEIQNILDPNAACPTNLRGTLQCAIR